MSYSDQQPATWAEAKAPEPEFVDLPDDGTNAALSWAAVGIVVVVLAVVASVVVGRVLYGMF